MCVCKRSGTFRAVLSDRRTCSSACPAPSAGRRCRSGPSAGPCAAARSPAWTQTEVYWADVTGTGTRTGGGPACERSRICLLSWTTSSCVRLNSESSWLWRKTNLNAISKIQLYIYLYTVVARLFKCRGAPSTGRYNYCYLKLALKPPAEQTDHCE